MMWIGITFFTIHIPAGKTGIRTIQYAFLGKKGVEQEDFGPGWHRALPMIDKWDTYDSTVQTLEMSKKSSTGDSAVQVRSSDGYQITVDVTVKYRIMPGKVHKLIKSAGVGGKYHIQAKTDTEDFCITRLGDMNTEDFYNPDKRRNAEKEIKNLLSKSLADKYIEVIDVLVRDVEFDPSYEGKIRNKKLADQRVELNKSKAKAEEMRGKTDVILAETEKELNIIQQEREQKKIEMKAKADLSMTTIRAEANRYVIEKRADADLKAAELNAKGTLAIKQAEAEGEKLRNNAMRGVGGRTIVALEAAKNLKLKNVTISTLETDILNVEAMAEKLGVESK
jgi:regulator of protease activity HflC (stomatin/prohibitin superfamily)